MKKLIINCFLLLTGSMTWFSCSSDDFERDINHAELVPISIGGEINQVNLTRANDSGFADKDQAGAFIVDYENGVPGELSVNGNRASNLRLTYDESSYRWKMAYDVYYKDQNTPVDIYSYYPFCATVNSVNAFELEVAQDQSQESTVTEKGGYEKSDFLWAKAANVSPKPQATILQYHHIMSSVKVVLTEGEGFDAGEWAQLVKNVVIKNTIRNTKINLSTGEVVADGVATSPGIIAYQKEDYHRAIVAPQTISAGVALLSIGIGDQSYNYTASENVEFVSGKINTFSFKVNKPEPTGDYEFKLIGESITAWENDNMAHNANLKEYVIINNEVAGELDYAIARAGMSLEEVRNLKITGVINAFDFYTMRAFMPRLQALNLKDVKIVASEKGESKNQGYWIEANQDNVLPNSALEKKTSLTNLVLPDCIKKIDYGAFCDCTNLTGSLIIPNGVEIIERAAFARCKNLTGTLSLPSTLKIIGVPADKTSDKYWDGAFVECGFCCELQIPESVELIGSGSFYLCSGLYGEIRLPDGLTGLGEGSFAACPNLHGSITIPQGVTSIPLECFAGSGFNGNLQLHDGITTISQDAFNGTPVKGVLNLPANLKTLSTRAFSGCDLSGELKLPSSLESIGDEALSGNWRLMGIVEIPEGVVSIGENAFAYCRMIEGVVLPESLESIRNGAFLNCFGIGSIVSKSEIPPHILGNAFDGVPKDNFTLEVPESAVATYQTEPGWMEFKRISAHHELVIRPSVANAINTQCTRTLVLNAEGDWMVESKPDWVSLSAMQGSNKAELQLTFSQMPSGNETREGEIVFKLQSKDYRSTCKVSQYDYKYAEDEIITLQKATRGNNGGINLVFLGDGYDAKDISSGALIANVNEQVENFFGIEPYKTYRDYFNVFTAIPVSTESGIGTINTIRYAKFETTFTGGVGLRADYDAIFDYAKRIPEVSNENLCQLTVVMIPNSKDYGGICYMYEDGSSIAFCPLSDYGYPLDTRGVIQHEAGGHGFGKLGDEYIYHNEFIDMCSCTCCPHVNEFWGGKSLGWFANLELTGKMHKVGWSHLIFDPRYSDIVDIYEGGYMHTRGVYRSEQNSCMNNNIPYYSTISREAIVRRIKSYAGETFDFEDFVANDSREPGKSQNTRANEATSMSRYLMRSMHSHPVIMKRNSK